MKIRKVKNNHEKKWRICEVYFWENWSEIFHPRKFNWVGFYFLTFHFEYDRFGPLYSFNIGVLGIGFYISLNPPWETHQSKDIQEQVKEAKEHPERLIPWDDFKDELAPPTSELGDIESDVE